MRAAASSTQVFFDTYVCGQGDDSGCQANVPREVGQGTPLRYICGIEHKGGSGE